MKVYLAGPITGLDFNGAQEWRTEFAEQLAQLDITGYSPLRLQEYLCLLGPLDSGGSGSHYEGWHPLTDPPGMVTRDRYDVETSDMVLVNLLGADQVSIGSVMEIAWADAFRIPLVVALDREGLHDHAMIRGVAGFIVYDLDMALECITGVLLP